MSALAKLGLKSLAATGSNEKLTDEQRQTRDAFAFKWAQRDTYESPAFEANSRQWLFERYCGGDPGLLTRWLEGGRKLILDAGCGSGFSARIFFGEHLKNHDYLGVDISEAAYVGAQRFKEAGLPGEFLQHNIATLPAPENSIDLIFSEGVLHHTDSTEKSLKVLAAKLKPGGRFLFYVYARKSDLREYTDDHIRRQIQPMNDEEAWEALKPVTQLGINLGKLNQKIQVPAVPLLGIEGAEMDVQRFFYWNVCKAFYRPDFSFDEMHHINFDWYRPLHCHRQTPEEVRRWCEEAGLTIERFCVQEAGITVVACRA